MEIYEAWKRETRAEGRPEGVARSLIVIYEGRFGAMPPELRAVVEGTEEEATLIAWLRLASTSSADTFEATLLASHAG